VLSPIWKDGDTVELTLPVRTLVRHWPQNQDAISIDRGPLTFSLAIEERWQRYGRENTKWPEWEVFPASSWNYGLVLDAPLEVVRAPGAIAPQPFTPAAAPIRIKAQARRIPEWQIDRFALVSTLQPSPARSSAPLETVTLIPMGAARLRISAFPWVAKDDSNSSAHEWHSPPQPAPPPWRVSASHVWSGDTVEAMADGLSPAGSNDQSIPRFTWWDHRGTHEWAQYDFDAARTIASIDVYWFDDRGTGGCRVPRAWRLAIKNGETFTPLPGEYPVARDQWNHVRLPAPITTSALRLEVDLEPGFSGGILEWRIGD
jgi:hypothetical protein